MTSPSLPPIGDVFQVVPDAARVDVAELKRMNDQALTAGRAGDLLALEALRDRIREIERRNVSPEVLQAVAAASHVVEFQRRKVKRGRRDGWL